MSLVFVVEKKPINRGDQCEAKEKNMTIPTERTRSVLQTKDFLERLLGTDKAEVPESIRVEARRLLRHYPSASDLRLAAEACPDWWGLPESGSQGG